MKTAVTILFLFGIVSSAHSNRLPMNWQVGDSCKITITTTTHTSEDGEVARSRSRTKEVVLRVTHDHGRAIELDFSGVRLDAPQQCNQLVRQLAHYPQYGHLEVVLPRIVLDKQSGLLRLLNWNQIVAQLDALKLVVSEIQNSTQTTNQLHDTLVIDSARSLALIVSEFVQPKDISEDAFIFALLDQMYYVFMPYGKDLRENVQSDISSQFSIASLYGSESTPLTYLTCTRLSDNDCSIGFEQSIDADFMLESEKESFIRRNVLIGVDEESAREMADEMFDAMSVAATCSGSFEYNLTTGWLKSGTLTLSIERSSGDEAGRHSQKVSVFEVQ